MASEYYPGWREVDAQLRAAGAFTVTMDGIRRRDATYQARVVSYDRATEAALEASVPPVDSLSDSYTVSQVVNVCYALRKPPVDFVTIECIRRRLEGWTLTEISALTSLSLSTAAGRIRRLIPRLQRAMPSSTYAALSEVLREAYLVELHSSWPSVERLRALKRLSMR